MKYKTIELEGEELDEAVALALGWKPIGGYWWEPGTIEKDGGLALPDGRGSQCMRRVDMYCRDWAHGGPIIESEGINPFSYWHDGRRYWAANMEGAYPKSVHGATSPLVAAMREFVAAKMGDEVDL